MKKNEQLVKNAEIRMVSCIGCNLHAAVLLFPLGNRCYGSLWKNFQQCSLGTGKQSLYCQWRYHRSSRGDFDYCCRYGSPLSPLSELPTIY